MRFDLFLVLFVVTTAACGAPTTSASSESFTRLKESDRALRVRPDKEGEEERNVVTTLASEAKAGVGNTAEAVEAAEALSPAIANELKAASDAARKVTEKSISAEEVVERVPGLDKELMENFNLLPKEQQQNLLSLAKEQVRRARNGEEDVMAAFVDVKPPEKAIPMLKTWFKHAKPEDKKKSIAEKLKEAGVVEKSFPDESLNSLMALGKTIDKNNRTGWQKFKKFLNFIGAVSLGITITAIYYSFHKSTAPTPAPSQ